jgi:hypothetical protein
MTRGGYTEVGNAKHVKTAHRGVQSLARRPPAMEIAAVYHIKVFGDKQIVTTGDGAFIWAIEEDIAGMVLWKVEIDVTTVSSSGIVQVQLRNISNGNVDMLSTRVQVDASEFHSKDAAVTAVVNAANADLDHGDRISIDVDAAGIGAKGLGLVFVCEAPVVTT